MPRRRVLLCLPDLPSEEILTVARTIKDALASEFQVRLLLVDEVDDEMTPVDNPAFEQSIVLRISEGDETP